MQVSNPNLQPGRDTRITQSKANRKKLRNSIIKQLDVEGRN
jgi:hypothetical protein